jgi:nucleotide-binding universal stress UspA family protein
MSNAQNPPAPQRVLVAVDGSDDSLKAAKTAIRIAKYNGSTLTLLHIRELPVGFADSEPIAESKATEESHESDVGKVIDDLVRSAQTEGVKAHKVIREHEKSVLHTILDYAEKERIDLIVVGTRGQGGFKKMLLGSVASGLTNYARCSVLIVR